jgi:hypothetical protein
MASEGRYLYRCLITPVGRTRPPFQDPYFKSKRVVVSRFFVHVIDPRVRYVLASSAQAPT